LAAWLAHRINNPLGAISGNSQLLARRLQQDIGDPEALKSYLRHIEAIQSQIERCAGITSEALSFTRPREPELRKLDVRDVVAEAVGLVQYARPDSRITPAADDKRRLPSVKADREWLARTVFELLSNAVEASCGGPVSVEVERVGSHRGRARVRVRVIDSGPGIPANVLPRVFDPFFSTREKARGLGLTLSLEMMQRMGGSLIVEKSDRSGSVFTIEIPVWKQEN